MKENILSEYNFRRSTVAQREVRTTQVEEQSMQEINEIDNDLIFPDLNEAELMSELSSEGGMKRKASPKHSASTSARVAARYDNYDENEESETEMISQKTSLHMYDPTPHINPDRDSLKLIPLRRLPMYRNKRNPQRRCKVCKKKCSYFCLHCSYVIGDRFTLFCYCNPCSSGNTRCYMNHVIKVRQGGNEVN